MDAPATGFVISDIDPSAAEFIIETLAAAQRGAGDSLTAP